MNLERLLKDLPSLPGITLNQAKRYYGCDLAALRRELRSPRMKRLVSETTALIRDRAVPGPIATVPRGAVSARAAGEIAYEAEKRWGETLSPTLIIQATAKLCALYGGEVTHTVTATLSHEVALVEVLLRKRELDPTFAWSLVSMRPGGGALADAASLSGDVLIELVGRYSGKLVQAKLELSATSTIELW